jgi:hypothetical protein
MISGHPPAYCRGLMDGNRLDDDAERAADAINNVLEAIGWALEELPSQQRRLRSASP